MRSWTLNFTVRFSKSVVGERNTNFWRMFVVAVRRLLSCKPNMSETIVFHIFHSDEVKAFLFGNLCDKWKWQQSEIVCGIWQVKQTKLSYDFALPPSHPLVVSLGLYDSFINSKLNLCELIIKERLNATLCHSGWLTSMPQHHMSSRTLISIRLSISLSLPLCWRAHL